MTYQIWGGVGVFIGLLLGIVGIVPLGIIAALSHTEWVIVAELIYGLVLTYGARAITLWLLTKIKAESASTTSNSWVVAGVIAVGVIAVGVIAVGALSGLEALSPSNGTANNISQSRSAAKAPQWLNDANAAHERRDYTTALRLVRPLADQGNALAQYKLGYMYDNGEGVPQNYAEAMKWYRLAAEQGDADAQTSLGSMYDNGAGVPQNYAEAMKWYRLAAEQGDADAQTSLGYMYGNGEGVPQNYAEAMKWYRLAAEQGDADAQTSLGSMYDNGAGAPQNYDEAMKWYRLAAEQGNALAQYSLGSMYDNGDGVRQDYVSAHMWFNLAAAQGSKDATKERDKLAADMTPAQIAEAQKLAREWKAKPGSEEAAGQEREGPGRLCHNA